MDRKMTILMWLSLIKDDTIRTQALTNYNESYWSSNISYSINDALWKAFDWDNSSERYNYWKVISCTDIQLKEPIKLSNTVVNTTTQKEWDLVTAYYEYEWTGGSWSRQGKHTCISCNMLDYGRDDYYKRNNYTILSFYEWLTQIGAVKITNEVKESTTTKLEIGKWYTDPFNKFMFYYNGEDGNDFRRSGFSTNGKWFDKGLGNGSDYKVVLASNEYVKERLLEYAKTKYKKGDKFLATYVYDLNTIEEISIGVHCGNIVVQNYKGGWLFREDKCEWAEILKTNVEPMGTSSKFVEPKLTFEDIVERIEYPNTSYSKSKIIDIYIPKQEIIETTKSIQLEVKKLIKPIKIR